MYGSFGTGCCGQMGITDGIYILIPELGRFKDHVENAFVALAFILL